MLCCSDHSFFTTSSRNMAEEVILSAIEEIDNLLIDNEETIQGKAEEFMEGIQNDLISILDFLQDSAPINNKLLNYLIADVIEIARDAQDDIRNMGSNVLSNPQISLIQGRLNKLKAMILQFGGEGGQGAEAPVPLIPPNVGENVVGLEETVESLLREHILQEEKIFTGYYTCVIDGVGGIGKTTLARELYNHADVAARFEHRAWVCVSGAMSNKQVLMELIVQVSGVGFELLEEMDNGSLQQILQHCLHDKPYFIVLDDVDEDAYLVSVLKALPLDEGSRLLITSQGLGQILAYFNHLHAMEFLDDDKSWKLFLKTIPCGNTKDQEFPKQLERRGRKMLEQCSGLPLAIIEAGRQLALKRQSGIEWEELLELPIDLTQTLAALEPTYHKLPSSAKATFLCLSFFEEGATIRVEKLLQIGILSGVILQEEGEYGLAVLKLESLIEVGRMSKDGRPKKLRVKIIFHRLSVRRAEEEINFEILRNDGKDPSSRKTLHRAMYCSREKFNYSINQDEHLVSLFFRGGGNFDASPCYWEHFEELIILDMEGFGLKMVPDAIGTLTRLKYLGLRNNHVQKLPLSLRCLRNLEVLDIALNFMVEVPDIIWEMDCLRHLYMSSIICLGPLKIDSLENLETLTYISVDNWKYEFSGLEMMTTLKKLGIEDISGEFDISKLFASLAKLKNLESLTLRGLRFKSMPLLNEIGTLHSLTILKIDGILTRLPSAENFPPNIEHLTLVNSSLDEDPMPELEKLSLRVLRLQNAYTDQQMVISIGGFWDLEFLCIKELWNLKNVQVGEYAMSNLERLETHDCPYLKILPEVKSHFGGFKIVTNDDRW